MTLVKICGVTCIEDALVATAAGADFIGLVFADSRRRVDAATAVAIVEALPPRPSAPAPLVVMSDNPFNRFRRSVEALERTLRALRPLVVGIFKDQPLAEVAALASGTGLDVIQLSGDENAAYCAYLDRPVLKTFDPSADICSGGLPPDCPPVVCMIDASHGNGVMASLAGVADISRHVPIVLAGGLTPANVETAVLAVHPWAVDVSSGVETDGRKDPQKIRAFIKAAKGVAS